MNMFAKRAQSLNEYAMVIVAVTLAAVAMQTYIKRGIQGVIKGSADVLTAGGAQPVAPVLTQRQQHLLNLTASDVPNTGDNWHPAVKAIDKGLQRSDGTLKAEKKGNDIYYYLNKDNVITTIGIEDISTGVYTSFGIDGYPVAVSDSAGMPQRVYERVENPTTKEVTFNSVDFSIVYKEGVPDVPVPVVKKDSNNKSIIIRAEINFSPYQILTLTDPSEEARAQINGIIEPGLYDYKQEPDPTDPYPYKPLTVHTDRSITSSEASLNNLTLSMDQAHPFVYHYYVDNGWLSNGNVLTKIKGNTVYYMAPDKKTLIGAENALSRDFTVFDQDGFVDVVFQQDRTPYSLVKMKYNEESSTDSQAEVKLIYNEESGTHKVLSVTVKQKVNGNWVDRGTYGKYQPVKVSQSAPAEPLTAITDAKRTKRTINTDTTEVTGAWGATYKLENAETFGKQDRTTRPGQTNPPTPPGGKVGG